MTDLRPWVLRDSGEPMAPWAVRDGESRGRRYAEAAPLLRGEFQRDRDRIIHSTAFRRLVYKTQVFVNHEGDLYRTRLTHTVEVAQIARTVARTLGLNEYLAEAISLAHDLGHTPFGHAGQDALNGCMQPYGGFEHNLQSLRAVDDLEEKYAAFPGLNLTFETREGILKHCSARNARLLGEVGKRFLERTQPSLEAQTANLADEIAYNNHDIDDGLRAGLLEIDSLREVELFGVQYAAVHQEYPDLAGRRLIHEIVRRMIGAMVTDVVTTSAERLARAAPGSVEDVRRHGEPLIAFSPPMQQRILALKQYLHRNLYRHYRVLRMATKAQRVVRELFEMFFAEPRLMPPAQSDGVREPGDGWANLAVASPSRRAADNAWGADEIRNANDARHASDVGNLEDAAPTNARARAVADYIAGMTDRYAIHEHQRLTDPAYRT